MQARGPDEALLGKGAGDNFQLELEAADAWGQHDPEAIVGVPIDAEDTSEMLADYAEQTRAPYRLLTDLPLDDRARAQALVISELGVDALFTDFPDVGVRAAAG